MGLRAAYVGLFTAIGALSAYLPLLYAARGLGLDLIGLLAGLYAAVAMLGAPAWGLVADAIGPRRPVVSIAAGAAAFAAVALAFATGPFTLALGAIALAVSMSGIMPIIDAQAVASEQARDAGYARLRVWGSAAFIGAVLVTGWLTDRFGAASMFWLVAPALAATAFVGLGTRAAAGPSRWNTSSLRALVRSRQLVAFLAAIFLTWTSSTTINAFFSIHLVDLDAPRWLVGVAWAIGAAVEIPIMLAYASIQRRFGLGRMLVVGAALLLVRAAAVVIFGDPLFAALTMAIHGAGFALLIVGGVLYAARLAPPGTAATVQGLLVAIVFGLAQVIGPGIGGLLANRFGLATTFAVAGAGSLLATLVLARVVARGNHGGSPGSVVPGV
ncbi:MAG: MFS transporter [Chloroflexota bacterium]